MEGGRDPNCAVAGTTSQDTTINAIWRIELLVDWHDTDKRLGKVAGKAR